jgi:peptide/nickel transport system permease protein
VIRTIVVRRLGHAVLLLLFITVISFAVMELAPGDFASEMRMNPQISSETIDAVRERYGLDHPLAVRYARWLWAAVRGDFGFSFAYNVPASSLLWVRARNTLIIAIPAMLIAWTTALLLGAWTAHRKGRWLDRVCGAVTSALLGVPDVLLALGALAFAAATGWFPTGGQQSLRGSEASAVGASIDLAWHAFLPTMVLVLASLPPLVRHVRAGFVEVLDAPALRAARGHGIAPRRLLVRHALPMAANPFISLAGFSVATLLSGSLLVEVVLSWPGLGPLLLDAILARDVHVVIGAVVLSTGLLAAANLLADLLLLAVDPRIRVE